MIGINLTAPCDRGVAASLRTRYLQVAYVLSSAVFMTIYDTVCRTRPLPGVARGLPMAPRGPPWPAPRNGDHDVWVPISRSTRCLKVMITVAGAAQIGVRLGGAEDQHGVRASSAARIWAMTS
jgi:hypothetical protein